VTALESPDTRQLSVLGMLRCAPGASPETLFATLAARPDVQTCLTVRGPWELVARFGADAGDGLQAELEAIDGVASARLVSAEVVPTAGSPEGPARALALLEVEPGAAASLAQQVGAMSSVEALDADAKREHLLVQLRAASFRALRPLLGELLPGLVGVRRVWDAQVLRFDDMPEAGPANGLHPLQRALWRYRPGHGELIPLLQLTQDTFGYVPEWSVELIAAITGVSTGEIFGIVTFYAQFRLQPLGRFVIRQCQGTACHVNGAKELQDVMEDALGIELGQTDDDGLFTLEKVACLGCCSLAPVLTINEDTHGRLEPAKLRKILRKYRRKAKQAKA